MGDDASHARSHEQRVARFSDRQRLRPPLVLRTHPTAAASSPLPAMSAHGTEGRGRSWHGRWQRVEQLRAT
jgi:hypothetical protein